MGRIALVTQGVLYVIVGMLAVAVARGDHGAEASQTGALEAIARFALKGTRRAADFHSEAPLPDIPADAAAQTLWLTLK